MHSSQYKALIDKYTNVCSQVMGLYGYLGNCSSSVSACKTSMSEVLIDGEAIDKGKLDNISSVLEGLQGAFNTVVAECKLKIATYEVLYASALEAERKELEEKNKSSVKAQ